jgi:hypothetical protein
MSARPVASGVCRLVLVALISVTLVAQDVWYRSYRDGVAAFNKGDYRTAEAKFTDALRAKDAPTARGHKVLYYSQLRDEFLPEYYLAVINAKNGNHAAALRFAAAAEKYIGASDREYTSLSSAKAASQNALNAAASVDSPRGGPPPRTAGDTAPVAPAASPSPSPRVGFDALIRQARAAVAERRWNDARTAAVSAKAMGVDNRQADDLLKSIDIEEIGAQVNARAAAREWSQATAAVDNLARVDPGNPLVASTRKTIAAGIAMDELMRVQRAGLDAFYRGNYQLALTTLGQARLDGAPALQRDRIRFYIACSDAALALLEGTNGKRRLAQAQQLYRQLRQNQALFAVDRRYISPQILSALQGPS